MRLPQTHYAKSGSVRIAYQVIGDGPVDLVFVPGYISNLDLHWEHAGYSHLLWRLASFSRLIMLDKRGTGLSDPVTELPGLETRMDDVRAVMDAVGSKRAALLGASEGGPMAMVFAATYPERTRALLLYGSYAHFPTFVLDAAALQRFIDGIDQHWGSGGSLKAFAPKRFEEPGLREWWARFERLGASPSAALNLARMNADIDVRPLLGAIRVPTLVLHRSEDPRIEIAAGRYLADKIAGAKFVELPGDDHPIWIGDTDRIVDEVEEFLTGTRPDAGADRILTTLLAVCCAEGTDEAGVARLRQRAAAEFARFRTGGTGERAGGAVAMFDGPARAVMCGAAILAAAKRAGETARAAIHTGDIVRDDAFAAGHAQATVDLLAAAAAPGQLLASATTRDLVAGAGLTLNPFAPRRRGRLPPDLRVYALAQTAGRASPTTAAPLSPRERQVLALIAQGLTNQAVAEALGLSRHTAKNR